MYRNIPIPPNIQGSIWNDTIKTRILQTEKINDMSISNIAKWKGCVNVSTTTNINLYGIQTIDNVVTIEENTILVKNQTNPIENGIYVIKENEWIRNDIMEHGTNAYGASIYVKSGTENGSLIYVCTSENGIVGINELIFSEVSVKDPLVLNNLTVRGNTTMGSNNNSVLTIGQGNNSTVYIGSGENTSMYLGDPTDYSNIFIGVGQDSYIEIGTTGTSLITIGYISSNIEIGRASDTTVRIGSSSSLMSFYGNNQILRPNTGTLPSAIAGGGGNIIYDNTTFDGYTVAQVVKALRNLGLIQ